MADIFISYRRDDSRADAGRLYDRLNAAFGDEHVFMDIEDIEPGDNFVSALEKTLGSCDVLIALIGPRWSRVNAAADRLGEPDDFVRLEIETALARGIHVIPVLVGGAVMPQADVLPDNLRALALRQALDVSDARYHQDVDRLIAELETFDERPDDPSRGRWPWVAATAAVLALAVALAWMVGPWRNAPQLRNEGADLTGDQVRAMLATHSFYHRLWNASGRGIENRYRTRVVGDDVVVEDAATGLIWQKRGPTRPVEFESAREYVARLNTQRFAGFDDWRIPTLEEAMSAMEPEAVDRIHINPVFEKGAAAILFTSDRAAGGRRWVVSYYDGDCHTVKNVFHAWVRAVRTAD